MSNRVPALLVPLVFLLALGGCVSLPTSGPVEAGPTQQQVDDEGALEFTPGGPTKGASPVDIVENFLVAMTATPLNTSVARLYLTDDSGRSWVPEKSTIVFGSREITSERHGVSLRLDDTVQLDGRGTWLGDPTGGKGKRWSLRLVKEDGEWRISHPPDALLIPRAHFDARFTQYFLYFFDKSSQVLVPEPVYVPRGAQAPTLLVSGLLRGPDPDLLGVERSALPARTRLDDLSVPVSRDGTAEVPLTDQLLDLDDRQLNLVFAQLAWTLRQIPGVDRMRVTVDGSPLDLPGEGADVGVGEWSEFDPAVAWASQSLFGLRGGRVVSVTDGAEHRLTGVFGSVDLGLRSVALDLAAENVAAVTEDGRRVLTGPRNATPSSTPTASDATTVYAGTDVLRPGYDLYGQLWLLDRTRSGARLMAVRHGTATTFYAPGVTGENVRSMLVSRDGTRLLTEVRTDAGDAIQVSRIQRGPAGQVRGLEPARQLALGRPAPVRVRDVAWRTPGSIALLITSSPDTSQVVVVRVDGSSALGDSATDAELFRGRAEHLVTSPMLGAPLYVGAATGSLFALAPTGRWTGSGIAPELRAPTFVG
jgi:Lipoprotein LpqB beta-propeller domain/Sporulation and spore germination